MKKICLCSRCIAAIRSRGEDVFVGEAVDLDESELENAPCEWCEETDCELFECLF